MDGSRFDKMPKTKNMRRKNETERNLSKSIIVLIAIIIISAGSLITGFVIYQGVNTRYSEDVARPTDPNIPQIIPPIVQPPNEIRFKTANATTWYGNLAGYWDTNAYYTKDTTKAIVLESHENPKETLIITCFRIIVNETKLKEILKAYYLFTSNGTSYIIKGYNTYIAAGDNRGVGFIFKHINGYWYIRPNSYTGNPVLDQSEWQYMLNQLIKWSTRETQPSTTVNQVDRFVTVSAATWYPGVPGEGITWNGNSIWLYCSSTETVFFSRVSCTENVLRDSLNVPSLYMTNGTPYAFIGIYANGARAYSTGALSATYDGTGCIYKHSDGYWYIRYMGTLTTSKLDYLKSSMLKAMWYYIAPLPKSIVVEVDASKWMSTGWYGTVFIWNSPNTYFLKISPTTSTGCMDVIISESALATKLGVATLYDDTRPIIFKGNHAFDNGAYTGTGFIFKLSDGKWYIRPLSTSGDWDSVVHPRIDEVVAKS